MHVVFRQYGYTEQFLIELDFGFGTVKIVPVEDFLGSGVDGVIEFLDIHLANDIE
jgi:hypothetical protein